MRTESISIYKFNELSDDKKQLVFENWRNNRYEYDWQSEWIDSLNGFAESTGITINNYELSPYCYSYVSWTFNHDWDLDIEALSGLRLRTWLINNWVSQWEKGKYLDHIEGKKFRPIYSKCQTEISCPLTGVGSDHDLIDPVLSFIAKPDDRDLNEIIQSCMDSFVKGYCADMEAQDSDEYITDTIEANEYEFYADGSLA